MNLKKLKRKLLRRPGQRAVIAVPYIWLLVLFLVPFAIVLKISFAEQEIAIPMHVVNRRNQRQFQQCSSNGVI